MLAYVVRAFSGLLLLGLLLMPVGGADAQSVSVVTVASDLRNPRGIAVYPDGRLLVAEAGDASGERERSGRLSVFADTNGDGDFDDAGERTAVMCCVHGYNTLTQFGTGLDEVGGLGDVVLLDDGRVFYTQDDPLGAYLPDGATRGIAIYGLTLGDAGRRSEVRLMRATTNALVYDADSDLLYAAESGLNRVSALTLDGDLQPILEFSNLASGQQPVPAGMTIDPRTGDLLVALFSGQLRDYYGAVLPYMPGDARIVRVNPATGEWREEIAGLTAAVDVAIDDAGNRYVVELATGWPAATMPRDFPLYDFESAPPDAGGYPRFSGRVTMFPADGGDPVPLAEGLDAPTNITYHGGALYVSVGQGTPGRRIIGPAGETRITGSIVKISGF